MLAICEPFLSDRIGLVRYFTALAFPERRQRDCAFVGEHRKSRGLASPVLGAEVAVVALRYATA